MSCNLPPPPPPPEPVKFWNPPLSVAIFVSVVFIVVLVMACVTGYLVQRTVP